MPTGRLPSKGAKVIVLVLAAVLAAGLVAPTAAGAAGTLSGKVKETTAGNPEIPYAMVVLYKYVTNVGWEQVDWDQADGSGNYSVTDTGVTGQYRVRFGKPGFKTNDWQTILAPIDLFLEPDPPKTDRLADSDRYSTAVKIARERFTTTYEPELWLGVDTIIIASGEDRAAADPLAAAGLCGAYDAPLFLVNSNGVPSCVKTAIAEIAATRTAPRVVIVGGPASVPDSVFDEINKLGSNPMTKDRIISTGDRFDLAAAIAERITQLKGLAPKTGLVANGADPEKFFDALALSTIAASKDYPILLVSQDSIPPATQNALDQLSGSKNLVVGGGPATISDDVLADLDQRYGVVERWSGSDRYKTATTIADKAVSFGWLDDELVVVAAKLPDALTGGATAGQMKGCLVVTNGETLTLSTQSWLAGHKASIDKCYVVGGSKSITDGVKTSINNTLQ
jgi:putative cell wall-binding protein